MYNIFGRAAVLTLLALQYCTLSVFSQDRADCELSITTVKRKKVCKNTVIFQDNFLTNNPSLWRKESFIPSYAGIQDEAMVFNYFDPDNVVIEDNHLEFVPKVMDDEFVRRGSLNLDKCTGTLTEECERTAQFQWILPPVSSGRITTKNSFSFKYGSVEIVAQVPKGDWLVPEMWLIPKEETYGPGLQSGKIIMFMARGNRVLESNRNDLGYKTLESSLVMSSQGKVRSRTLRVKSEEPWQSHYNKYIFTWRPDEITVSTNGIIVGNLVFKNLTDTLAKLVGFSHEEEKMWFKGTAMAPFDQEFYISLGLSVGGREFPDDSISNNYPKPWKSRTVKEMLNFWRSKDKWESTWSDEESRFKILKIKVKSL